MSVGIKADVFAFLLGTGGARQTVTEIALATHYHNRAVRRAVAEMVVARFVEAVASAPATFRVLAEPWTAALNVEGDLPPWRYWQELFALGAALDDAAESGRDESPYLQASRARDVMEIHRRAFEVNAVPLTRPELHPGEAYLAALGRDTAELGRRITTNFIA